MSTSVKLLAAAVAIVIAVFGIGVPLRTAIVGPGGSPTPSASALAYVWPGPLTAGTYTTRFLWNAPITVTFTIGDGWDARDVEVIKDPVSRVNEIGGSGGVSVEFMLIGNVYADPCAATPSDPVVGPSVAELAVAMSQIPGTRATTPVPVTLAGYPGEYLEVTLPTDMPCDAERFRLWDELPGSRQAGLPAGATYWSAERPLQRLWILDIHGVRYVIGALSDWGTTAADDAALQAVVDSIRIDWTADSASIGPCTVEFTEPVPGQAPDSVPANEPFRVTMGPGEYEVRGVMPAGDDGEPILPPPPVAQLDFASEDSWGRGADVMLTGPSGGEAGLAVSVALSGYQGSFVFDEPGQWLALIRGDSCLRQFPVEVLQPVE